MRSPRRASSSCLEPAGEQDRSLAQGRQARGRELRKGRLQRHHAEQGVIAHLPAGGAAVRAESVPPSRIGCRCRCPTTRTAAAPSCRSAARARRRRPSRPARRSGTCTSTRPRNPRPSRASESGRLPIACARSKPARAPTPCAAAVSAAMSRLWPVRYWTPGSSTSASRDPRRSISATRSSCRRRCSPARGATCTSDVAAVEAVPAELRHDGVAVRRKRAVLDQDHRRSRIRAVEARHQQVQVDRERVHHDRPPATGRRRVRLRSARAARAGSASRPRGRGSRARRAAAIPS